MQAWINPTLRDTVALIDRFPPVYRAGSPAYRTRLDAFVQTLRLP